MVLCVCHGHHLFGIGYHFKIFRSQVATGKKKVNFTPCTQRKVCGFRNILIPVEAMPHSMDNFPTSVVKFRFYLFFHYGQLMLRPRPHVSGNLWKRKFFFTNTACVHTYPAYFSGRIRKFLKTLSRVKIFLSNTNTYTCGWSYPQICEYAYVIFLDPVLTSSIINKRRTARLYLLC